MISTYSFNLREVHFEEDSIIVELPVSFIIRRQHDNVLAVKLTQAGVGAHLIVV